MKVISRIAAVAISFVMLSVAFTACSVEKDILGDWTVSTIDGKTCEEYASALGVASNMVSMNLKLESDKATLTGVKGSKEFGVSYKSNGVELMSNGAVAGSIAYDKDAQTLSMKDNSTGAIIEYVFTKGTTDLTAATENTEATSAETSGSEETSGTTTDEYGLTGADYGERSEEELTGETTDEYGLTGADYGERSADELTGETTDEYGLTGADYGENSAD